MTNIEYWVKEANGNETLAKELYFKFQTRDLDYFVNKYGQEEGTIRHSTKTAKWVTTMDAKSSEEKVRINKLKAAIGSRSKAEKELEKILISQNFQVTSQYLIDKPDGTWFSYDLRVGNKLIEYNGDYWHCNPSKYIAESRNNHIGKTAKEIWEKDTLKIANDNGYSLMTVWESDYKKNKHQVIQECINFLTQ